MLKNYKEAVGIYDLLINLLPSDAEHIANRGIVYHHLGEQKLSISDLTKSIELEPKNSYRYASRAFIKDFIGNHSGAIEDYNKAIELDPEDVISINNRGMLEEKLGRMHQAEKSFARADDLIGVDMQYLTQHEQTTKTAVAKKDQFTFGYFISIIKSLIASAKERKSFIKFLFRH